MMESGKTRGIVRKTERMAKEIESGEIVEELKELRKVMEEMVSVLRKVASGLERREDVEQVSERNEIRGEREGARIEESWEREKSVKEERREQEESRKMEESTLREWKVIERRKRGGGRRRERVRGKRKGRRRKGKGIE